MLSRLAVFFLVSAFLAGTVTATSLGEYGVVTDTTNGILQQVNDLLSSAKAKFEPTITSSKAEIQKFLDKTSREIEKAFKSVYEQIKNLASGSVPNPSDVTKILSDTVKKLIPELIENVQDLVKGLISSFPKSRDDTSIEPALLTEALNVHLLLLNQLVNIIGKLNEAYNNWSKGLLGAVLGTLTDGRMSLLDSLDDPIPQLCQIENDTSGSLAGAIDNATVTLNNVRTTAQTTTSNCYGLGCVLIVPKAALIVKNCGC